MSVVTIDNGHIWIERTLHRRSGGLTVRSITSTRGRKLTITTSNLVRAHLPCPACNSSDAYATYDDGHGFCFSCNHYEPPKDRKEDVGDSYQYIQWRGITADTFRFYDSKFKVDSTGRPLSVSFQYPNGATKVRQYDTKSFHSTGEINKAGLFGRDKFDPLAHKSITVTEGELDALSVWQMCNSPAVSISSSSGGLRDCTRDFSWLCGFETIRLCLDNDGPGRTAASEIARLFGYGKVLDVKLNRHKDANAYLQAGEETEFRNIWYTAKPYLPETIRSSLSDFKTILEISPEQGLPYGPFTSLTEMTYGIRRGETVLITAREGVGKTEFLHAIEHSLLSRGDTRLGGFFLEEQPKRHLQSLAGIHLRRPVHLPDSGVSVSETQAAIEQLIREDDQLFLDVHFGSRDIESILGTSRYLVAGAGCSVLVLDHVSLAVSETEGDQERRQLDHFFTKAETMAKELNFAWLVVQHVNDFGQTRGSRWGGKMADVRIDLHRDVENGSNVLDIFVSKNRFAGRTGHAGSYEFNPISRSYTPIASNDNGKQQFASVA